LFCIKIYPVNRDVFVFEHVNLNDDNGYLYNLLMHVSKEVNELLVPK